MRASELVEILQRHIHNYGDELVLINNTSFNNVIAANRLADNRILLVDSSCGQPLGYVPFSDVNDMKRWFSAAGFELRCHVKKSEYTNDYQFWEAKIFKDVDLFGMMRYENFECRLTELWEV